LLGCEAWVSTVPGQPQTGHGPDAARARTGYRILLGHVLERPNKRSRFAEFEDIDYEACLSEMEQLRPGYAHREKAIILSWSILYYYLM